MSTNKPSLLILCFTNFNRDPRVAKQVTVLENDFDLTLAGLQYSGPHKFIQLMPTTRSLVFKIIFALLLKLRLFHWAYWSNPSFREAKSKLQGLRFEFILANDMTALPLAVAIKKDSKLVYDAHEYSPLEFEDSKIWHFLFHDFIVYQLKSFAQKIDSFTTVCSGIADKYQAEFGLKAQVFLNTPEYKKLSPQKTSEKIKIVCHSAAIRARRLEAMVDIAQYLDSKFELNLILMPTDPAYVLELKDRASKYSNVKFLDPVPMPQIPDFLNQFDIGLYSIEPNSFNNKYSLPNKFFEFIQARLAIVTGPSPEMQKIIDLENIGTVAQGFAAKDLADAINQLSVQDIETYKKNSDLIALKYSAQKSWEQFKNIFTN